MSKEQPESAISRRSFLSAGVAAASGAVALTTNVSGQTVPSIGGSGKSAGLKYRAFVRHGTTGSIELLTMRQITGRQVLVRNQAASCTYGDVGAVLGTGGNFNRPTIVGNGSVGIVEEVGPEVQAVRVGDRVIVAVTPQCGRCDYCLRGLAGLCQAVDVPLAEIAETADGTPVIQFGWAGGKGGLAEYTVVYEELVIPVFTDLPPEQLAFLIFLGAHGYASVANNAPPTPGADVVVFGAGPTGLSAIQAARLHGAARIIAVEPIPARREMAMKVGATHVVDPNEDSANLVERLRALCRIRNDRPLAGGRGLDPNFGTRSDGPSLIVEAVGADSPDFPPKIAGPDPKGLLPLQQMWDLCPPGGHIMTQGTGYPRNSRISVPASEWADGGKSKHSMNSSGVHSHHDIPLLIKMVENKHYEVASLISGTYRLEHVKDCYQAIADRSVIAVSVVFT